MKIGPLRLGIVLMVTGLIVLAHRILVPQGTGRISPELELAIGIVLVVVGIPFLIAATRNP